MIGIRKEDKSKWEARVPLTPDDVRRLHEDSGVAFQVQSSPVRAIPNERFTAAGAAITERLDACPIVIGVKEVPK